MAFRPDRRVLSLRLRVYPIIGSRPIAAVRPSEIQAMVRRLSEDLAPSTLAVVYGRVVAVLRLGHSSAKTTLDVYGHLFPDEEDRTRQAIEGAFADDSEALCESAGSMSPRRSRVQGVSKPGS
jgi:hypothetical protein